jgi:hypothetical protein
MNNLQNRYTINSSQPNKVFKRYKMINYSTFLHSPFGGKEGGSGYTGAGWNKEIYKMVQILF